MTSIGQVGRFAESRFELDRPIDQSAPAHDGAPKFQVATDSLSVPETKLDDTTVVSLRSSNFEDR